MSVNILRRFQDLENHYRHPIYMLPIGLLFSFIFQVLDITSET